MIVLCLCIDINVSGKALWRRRGISIKAMASCWRVRVYLARVLMITRHVVGDLMVSSRRISACWHHSPQNKTKQYRQSGGGGEIGVASASGHQYQCNSEK